MTAESLPKHYLVRAHVEDLLADLSEGDPVPAERELAARCGVSRETVRQALHELLVAGRVERRGRGTVVARPKMVQPLSLGSYTEGALSQGREPGRVLVRWEEIDAHSKLAEILQIGVGDPVIHLERVLLADGERIGLESTYLPLYRFPDLSDTFDPETSLYAAIRARGIEFTTATERIETALPTPREAGLVESSTAMPMLKLHRVSRDADGVPIERVRSLYRGDRMAFVTELR
ncbi:UTRA domain-containing protein [Rhodococcus hoagii]|jgi:GntR family transcriptional regulator|uniref:GntR family transcriptional regulator n=1 Tax=Rhodococcus hoagii (strain 103S) TaxID=685727 RepID=A0A3S5Y617_RHOH1|nr:GntR family transcriptional regulator [Prescottella equi]GBF14842.1 HTH-type transcriptional repressor PhnF [Rhodococcus sp. Br-6]MDP8015501.1 GntR family transcriptional regulator [Prescottella equi]NKR69837.1 UTRA domain-containing protein [Prescottella equi]NKR86113.1 UTRA domain-containing protein [Prescottella equi]NKS05740.1 UTRA domain-containing protein [Prescottella equi]